MLKFGSTPKLTRPVRVKSRFSWSASSMVTVSPTSNPVEDAVEVANAISSSASGRRPSLAEKREASPRETAAGGMNPTARPSASRSTARPSSMPSAEATSGRSRTLSSCSSSKATVSAGSSPSTYSGSAGVAMASTPVAEPITDSS